MFDSTMDKYRPGSSLSTARGDNHLCSVHLCIAINTFDVTFEYFTACCNTFSCFYSSRLSLHVTVFRPFCHLKSLHFVLSLSYPHVPSVQTSLPHISPRIGNARKRPHHIFQSYSYTLLTNFHISWVLFVLGFSFTYGTVGA
jgi:hypothetical protein